MSPEAKQGWRLFWEESQAYVIVYGLAISGLISYAVVNPWIKYPACALLGYLIAEFASYLSRTRWAGKPIILITAEAAQAIQSGKFNLKTKEQVH